jgi:predicted nucleic acid-binding protein
MPGKRPIYWDSCIFLDWLKGNKPERTPLIQEVVTAIENDTVLIVTSSLSLVETSRLDSGVQIEDKDEEKIAKFFQNSYIEIKAIDRAIANESRRLIRESGRRQLGLSCPDSIHLATALFCGITEMHTFDNKLIKHDGVWGQDGKKLCICPPRIKGHQPELFTDTQPAMQPAVQPEARPAQQAKERS